MFTHNRRSARWVFEHTRCLVPRVTAVLALLVCALVSPKAHALDTEPGSADMPRLAYVLAIADAWNLQITDTEVFAAVAEAAGFDVVRVGLAWQGHRFTNEDARDYLEIAENLDDIDNLGDALEVLTDIVDVLDELDFVPDNLDPNEIWETGRNLRHFERYMPFSAQVWFNSTFLFANMASGPNMLILPAFGPNVDVIFDICPWTSSLVVDSRMSREGNREVCRVLYDTHDAGPNDFPIPVIYFVTGAHVLRCIELTRM